MTTAQTWSSAEAAEMWRKGAARRAQVLAMATERMLAGAALAPGMRVLDVAAGTGDQSLLAAARVGPTGSVLATDISSTMLAAAADAAREAGIANLETRVADASTLDFPAGTFDAAICRFGLMFVPDLQSALTRICTALKSDARLAALVWSTEERNPWIGMQLDLVRSMGRLPSPPPSISRTTLLSEPGKFERELQAAGFVNVEVSAVATTRDFSSLDEAWNSMLTSSPSQGELTRAMNDREREQFAAELKRRVAAFVRADGRCVVPGEALVGVGAVNA